MEIIKNACLVLVSTLLLSSCQQNASVDYHTYNNALKEIKKASSYEAKIQTKIKYENADDVNEMETNNELKIIKKNKEISEFEITSLEENAQLPKVYFTENVLYYEFSGRKIKDTDNDKEMIILQFGGDILAIDPKEIVEETKEETEDGVIYRIKTNGKNTDRYRLAQLSFFQLRDLFKDNQDLSITLALDKTGKLRYFDVEIVVEEEEMEEIDKEALHLNIYKKFEVLAINDVTIDYPNLEEYEEIVEEAPENDENASMSPEDMEKMQEELQKQINEQLEQKEEDTTKK